MEHIVKEIKGEKGTVEVLLYRFSLALQGGTSLHFPNSVHASTMDEPNFALPEGIKGSGMLPWIPSTKWLMSP